VAGERSRELVALHLTPDGGARRVRDGPGEEHEDHEYQLRPRPERLQSDQPRGVRVGFRGLRAGFVRVVAERFDARPLLGERALETLALALEGRRPLRERAAHRIRNAVDESGPDARRVADVVGGEEGGQIARRDPEHLRDGRRQLAGTRAVENRRPVLGEREGRLGGAATGSDREEQGNHQERTGDARHDVRAYCNSAPNPRQRITAGGRPGTLRQRVIVAMTSPDPASAISTRMAPSTGLAVRAERSSSCRCAVNLSRTAAGMPSIGKFCTTTRPVAGPLHSNRTIRDPMMGGDRNARATAAWKADRVPSTGGAAAGGAAAACAGSPLRLAIMSSICLRAVPSGASPRAIWSSLSAAGSFPCPW